MITDNEKFVRMIVKALLVLDYDIALTTEQKGNEYLHGIFTGESQAYTNILYAFASIPEDCL